MKLNGKIWNNMADNICFRKKKSNYVSSILYKLKRKATILLSQDEETTKSCQSEIIHLNTTAWTYS